MIFEPFRRCLAAALATAAISCTAGTASNASLATGFGAADSGDTLAHPRPDAGTSTGGVTSTGTGQSDSGPPTTSTDETDNADPGGSETGEALGDCPTLGPWQASDSWGDVPSHPLPSFAIDDWFYVHTQDAGRVLYAAQAQPDGALGPWQIASRDHGGGPHGFTAIDVGGTAFHFRNGHIAAYPLTNGLMEGDVVLYEDDVDAAFGGQKYVWDSAVVVDFDAEASVALHLGGFSFTPYAYVHELYRSHLPLGPMFHATGTNHPASRPGKAAAFTPSGASLGFIFTTEAEGPGLWRLSAAADGRLGAWEQLPALPRGTGNQRGDLWVTGRALFVVRGASVFQAIVGDDGTLSPWAPQPSLPAAQVDVSWGDGHLEGAAVGVIGSHVYLTGPRRVFYAPLVPSAC